MRKNIQCRPNFGLLRANVGRLTSMSQESLHKASHSKSMYNSDMNISSNGVTYLLRWLSIRSSRNTGDLQDSCTTSVIVGAEMKLDSILSISIVSLDFIIFMIHFPMWSFALVFAKPVVNLCSNKGKFRTELRRCFLKFPKKTTFIQAIKIFRNDQFWLSPSTFYKYKTLRIF